MNDFERVLGAARQLAAGQRVPGVTLDTLTVKGMCAQAARQTVEAGLGLGPNGWEVARGAEDERRRRRGSIRWALDYMRAARAQKLGLKEAVPGCLLYWDYSWRDPRSGVVSDFGHVAVYLGEVEGVDGPAMLENTNAASRAGGRRPFGTLKNEQGQAVLSPLFVSPLSVMGKPAFIFAPTLAARDAALGVPEPAVKPGQAQVFLSRNGTEFKDVSGQRLDLALKARRLIVNADNPGKVYIRTEEG